jgi:hypothetical protein
MRSLKRQLSDAVFTRLRADVQRVAARAESPGGQTGNGSVYPARSAHTPDVGSSGKPVPGPVTTPTAVTVDPAPGSSALPGFPR